MTDDPFAAAAIARCACGNPLTPDDNARTCWACERRDRDRRRHYAAQAVAAEITRRRSTR